MISWSWCVCSTTLQQSHAYTSFWVVPYNGLTSYYTCYIYSLSAAKWNKLPCSVVQTSVELSGTFWRTETCFQLFSDQAFDSFQATEVTFRRSTAWQCLGNNYSCRLWVHQSWDCGEAVANVIDQISSLLMTYLHKLQNKSMKIIILESLWQLIDYKWLNWNSDHYSCN